MELPLRAVSIAGLAVLCLLCGGAWPARGAAGPEALAAGQAEERAAGQALEQTAEQSEEQTKAAAADSSLNADKHLAEHGWSLDSLHVEGIDRPGVRRVTASGRLRLPARMAWEVILGDKRSEKWPGVEESVREYVHADTMITRYRLGVPIFKDRRYRMRFLHDSAQRNIHFEMVPGYGNVREARGFWKIVALSDSLTQVLYQIDTDPGMSYIPRFLVNWATKRQIPKIYGHIYEEGSHFLTLERERPAPEPEPAPEPARGPVPAPLPVPKRSPRAGD